MKTHNKIIGILLTVLLLFVLIISILYYNYMRKQAYTNLVNAGSLHSACLVVEVSDKNKAIEVLNWAMDYSISNCWRYHRFLPKKDQEELSTLIELLGEHRKEYSWNFPLKTNNTTVEVKSIFSGARRRTMNSININVDGKTIPE